MKTSELMRILSKHGCYFLRHGGRHDIWYSPITGEKLQIDRHAGKEIAVGTADNILKKAGIK